MSTCESFISSSSSGPDAPFHGTMSDPTQPRVKRTGLIPARPVYLYCDIEDLAVLETLDPKSFNSRIDDYVSNKGGDCTNIKTCLFVEKKTDALVHKFPWDGRNHTYVLPKDDQILRINLMCAYMLLEAKLEKKFPTNFLFLTNNKNFGHGTRFSDVRSTLEGGGFYVDVLQFDQLMSPLGEGTSAI